MSITAEIKLPPECIKSLSVLPGMALQMRMPPTDVLGSCQNPCMGSLNPEKGPKTEVNPGRSEVKALQTTPSYRAQADSATSFYIFIGHMREAQKRVYILSDEKKKKFIETAILELLPGKAQPLVRKLDNLLAAVGFPRKVFKDGIVPVVLLRGLWITKIEISEPRFHLSLVFTQQQLLWRILLAFLGGPLLTNCHCNGSGSASRTR